MTQIGGGTELPVVHTVELLDWVYGGPVPASLAETPLAGRTVPRVLEAAG